MTVSPTVAAPSTRSWRSHALNCAPSFALSIDAAIDARPSGSRSKHSFHSASAPARSPICTSSSQASSMACRPGIGSARSSARASSMPLANAKAPIARNRQRNDSSRSYSDRPSPPGNAAAMPCPCAKRRIATSALGWLERASRLRAASSRSAGSFSAARSRVSTTWVMRSWAADGKRAARRATRNSGRCSRSRSGSSAARIAASSASRSSASFLRVAAVKCSTSSQPLSNQCGAIAAAAAFVSSENCSARCAPARYSRNCGCAKWMRCTSRPPPSAVSARSSRLRRARPLTMTSALPWAAYSGTWANARRAARALSTLPSACCVSQPSRRSTSRRCTGSSPSALAGALGVVPGLAHRLQALREQRRARCGQPRLGRARDQADQRERQRRLQQGLDAGPHQQRLRQLTIVVERRLEEGRHVVAAERHRLEGKELFRSGLVVQRLVRWYQQQRRLAQGVRARRHEHLAAFRFAAPPRRSGRAPSGGGRANRIRRAHRSRSSVAPRPRGTERRRYRPRPAPVLRARWRTR